MSTAYARITDTLLSHGSQSRDVRQNHSMWQCPVHDDNNPSLAVDDKGDRAVMHCHAKCNTDDILTALGLSLADLFDGDLETHAAVPNRHLLVRSYLYERANGDPWFYVDRYYPKTFRQRLPGVEPVRDLADASREDMRRLGLKDGRAPIIYHAPRVMRAIAKGDAVVWWLDGEKDVETAEKHGLVATCPPGFAKWDPKYAAALKGAKQIVMVVDQDKEKPDGTLGAGHQAAIAARLGFRAVGLKVHTVKPCMGKDLSDHFAAGCKVEDFQVDTALVVRPRGMDAPALMAKEFEPVRWLVDDLLPSGLTILAGSPKVGKSWVCLDVASAVAAGGPALGHLATNRANVLYLAREDTYRRLQSRLALVMGGNLSDLPKELELVPGDVEWVGGEEGLAHLTEWAEEVANPGLVVIDTIAKVETAMGESVNGRSGNAYAAEYAMAARYKQWSDDHNVAVVMVHHDRKQGGGEKQSMGMAADPFTKISGTRGLTGAADTLMFLESERGTGEGQLHYTGRDVPEDSIEMRKVGPLWQAVSNPRSAH